MKMSINALLRTHVASLESVVQGPQVQTADEYIDFRAAMEEYEALADALVSLESHISLTSSVESLVEGIHEDGVYDAQAMVMHAQVVNSIKDALGEAPVTVEASVESLTHVQVMASRISLESKGFMAKAWDAVVELCKKIVAAIAKVLNAINPWAKKHNEEIKQVAKEVASGESEIVVPAKVAQEEKKLTEDIDKAIKSKEERLKDLDAILTKLEKGDHKSADLMKELEELTKKEVATGVLGDDALGDRIRKFLTEANSDVLDGYVLSQSDLDRYMLDKDATFVLDGTGKTFKRIEALAKEGKGGAPVATAIANEVNKTQREIVSLTKDRAGVSRKMTSNKRKKDKGKK